LLKLLIRLIEELLGIKINVEVDEVGLPVIGISYIIGSEPENYGL